MQVRRASDEEAKRLAEFDVFAGDRRVDNRRGELLVCVDDNGEGGTTVVGFVVFSSNVFYNLPFISFLIVREGHRRRGIAERLVARVLEHFEGLHVWISTEEANEPAIRLFHKLGFDPRGRIEGLDRERSVELFFCHPAPR